MFTGQAVCRLHFHHVQVVLRDFGVSRVWEGLCRDSDGLVEMIFSPSDVEIVPNAGRCPYCQGPLTRVGRDDTHRICPLGCLREREE